MTGAAARLRVALVGTGRVGCQFRFSDLPDNHAAAVVASDRLQLVAGVNRGRQKLVDFGARFGVDGLYLDHRQMLDEVRPDVVIIATHPELHCQMVLDCAAAPSVRAIVCEKPMALSLAECDDMIQACQRRDVLLQINHNRRWHPEWQLASRLLADGAIGDLYHIYGYMDGCKPHPSWRSENEGPLLHDYTHYFDLMDLYGGPVAWLCGMAEQRRRPWAVEDFSAAFLKFESGASGLVCAAELTAYTDHGFELRGTTGVIRMAAERVCLFQAHHDITEPDSGFQWRSLRPCPLEHPAPASTYAVALAELVAALDGHGQLGCDGAVGRRSLELITAVYQSQLSGNRPVAFPVSDPRSGVAAMRHAGQFRPRDG